MKQPRDSGRPYPYRVAPHKVMKSEYPQPYYKFRNYRVAFGFWLESMGNEIKNPPKHIIHKDSTEL